MSMVKSEGMQPLSLHAGVGDDRICTWGWKD